jgi:alcohol dehydrogenase, propanol-preferring
MEVRDIAVPDPGPGEVLVQVAGAGLCHSDVMIAANPGTYGAGGFVLGHETAGRVEALGPGVSGVGVGEPVAVHSFWGCGVCPTCRRGDERFCPAVRPTAGAGLGRNGGMAEHILVPAARHLVPLGDVDPVDAGPLDDAALTPYHAIQSAAAADLLGPGSVAVVIGVGGLGHLAVQILRALTVATMIAVELDEGRRRFALELGADAALHPDDDLAARVRSLRPEGAAFVLDLVGSDSTLRLAASLPGTGGRITLVGAALGTLPWSLIAVPFECQLQTSYGGEARELAEVVALAAAGRIRVHTERIPLDAVPSRYEELDRGRGPVGRTVAVPSS